MTPDRRVVNLRRRYAALAAALEAAPDEATENHLLDTEGRALVDSLHDLLMSRPEIKVTPGELYDPRELKSDIVYRWAVVYFHGPWPERNRNKVVEAVIHGVPSGTTRQSIKRALQSSSHATRLSDRYGNFLANRKIIEYTDIPDNDDDSSDRIAIDWGDLEQ